MDNPALLGALSLCRKAGALALGHDAVEEALKTGKAQLLLFAADISEGTRRRLQKNAPEGLRAETLPLSKEALATLTRKPVGALAVTNAQLAALCLSKWPQTEA